ncbi:uncharacterized protein LOC115332546 isoform X4 [Ixodes scapularis]|uniref:uncharacterized protein LOC115332546 isoform X4 n=1 Tax=Ixodes scapularis TaxID=6945 RepID=UPI001C389B02|nr:uncharacterized protein LOC115332546 isoform X4 [Ixodes scapularis]
MYAIVEFRLTQEVEIVPYTWVTGNNCLWPKVSTDKAVKLVRKGGPPGPGFSEFEVTVKGLFNSYEEGRSKLERSRFTSDLSDEEIRPKRRRFRPTRWSESDSSSDEFPEAPMPLCARQNSPSSQRLESQSASPARSIHSEMSQAALMRGASGSSQSSSTSINTLAPSPQDKDASGFSTASQTLTRMSAPSRLDQALQAMQHMTPSTSASTCADLRATARILSAAEFQRRVLNGMSVMRSQQTEIMDMISTLLRARESFVVEPSQPILVDPLDTPEAIEVFDGALTDATSEALVVELTSLGDLSIKTTVRSMLAHLISDEAAAKFSMDGRKGKKVFRSLKLYKLIFAAIKRTKHCKESTKKEVETEVKEWLRRAKERCTTSKGE